LKENLGHQKDTLLHRISGSGHFLKRFMSGGNQYFDVGNSLTIKSTETFCYHQKLSHGKVLKFCCCLKSAVTDENEPTKISEVHAGARLNGINHNLQLEYTKLPTYTSHITSEWQFKHCIINISNAPY
jgi:hypothetical protein